MSESSTMPFYKTALSKPLDEIREDIFLRADAFEDAPWYEDFQLYTRIGTCCPKGEHAAELQKALKMMGYPTHTAERNGKTYILPGEGKNVVHENVSRLGQGKKQSRDYER